MNTEYFEMEPLSCCRYAGAKSTACGFRRPARNNCGWDCCKVHKLTRGCLVKGAVQSKLLLSGSIAVFCIQKVSGRNELNKSPWI